jgi:hypothetical protein
MKVRIQIELQNMGVVCICVLHKSLSVNLPCGVLGIYILPYSVKDVLPIFQAGKVKSSQSMLKFVYEKVVVFQS